MTALNVYLVYILCLLLPLCSAGGTLASDGVQIYSPTTGNTFIVGQPIVIEWVSTLQCKRQQVSFHLYIVVDEKLEFLQNLITPPYETNLPSLAYMQTWDWYSVGGIHIEQSRPRFDDDLYAIKVVTHDPDLKPVCWTWSGGFHITEGFPLRFPPRKVYIEKPTNSGLTIAIAILVPLMFFLVFYHLLRWQSERKFLMVSQDAIARQMAEERKENEKDMEMNPSSSNPDADNNASGSDFTNKSNAKRRSVGSFIDRIRGRKDKEGRQSLLATNLVEVNLDDDSKQSYSVASGGVNSTDRRVSYNHSNKVNAMTTPDRKKKGHNTISKGIAEEEEDEVKDYSDDEDLDVDQMLF